MVLARGLASCWAGQPGTAATQATSPGAIRRPGRRGCSLAVNVGTDTQVVRGLCRRRSSGSSCFLASRGGGRGSPAALQGWQTSQPFGRAGCLLAWEGLTCQRGRAGPAHGGYLTSISGTRIAGLHDVARLAATFGACTHPDSKLAASQSMRAKPSGQDANLIGQGDGKPGGWLLVFGKPVRD